MSFFRSIARKYDEATLSTKFQSFYFYPVPPLTGPSSEDLTLRAICRIIHAEASALGFQKVQFSLTTASIQRLQTGIYHLGGLRNNLRNVSVSIDMHELHASKCNPFVLLHLPLSTLTVDLGEVNVKCWHDEVDLYHRFVSSLLYRPSSAVISSLTANANANDTSKSMHLINRFKIATLAWESRRTDLVLSIFTPIRKSIKLVVKTRATADDILWNAMKFFGNLTPTGGRSLMQMRIRSLGEELAGFYFFEEEGDVWMEMRRVA